MKNGKFPSLTALSLLFLPFLYGCDFGLFSDYEDYKDSETRYREPTPADYVCEAMTFLCEYNALRQNSMEQAQQRAQGYSNDVQGVMGVIGDIRSFSETQARYLRNVSTIDISNCPVDFQTKFRNYVQLETEILNLLAGFTHPDSLEGFLGGTLNVVIRGDQLSTEINVATEALFSLARDKYGFTY
ncbi:MAG: hypothetical protein Q4C70_07060 [Planctomycetia bacterium]|nr:hypothetical protein [Planctomycetia bacterium]